MISFWIMFQSFLRSKENSDLRWIHFTLNIFHLFVSAITSGHNPNTDRRRPTENVSAILKWLHQTADSLQRIPFMSKENFIDRSSKCNREIRFIRYSFKLIIKRYVYIYSLLVINKASRRQMLIANKRKAKRALRKLFQLNLLWNDIMKKRIWYVSTMIFYWSGKGGWLSFEDDIR